MSHRGMNPVDVVDGAATPELIPDSSAYRLFLVVVGVSSSPSVEDAARQTTNVAKIGLSDSDSQALIAVANDFKVAYESAMAAYNTTADALQAGGQVPDVDSFIAQRDLLVESTLAKLKSTLSPPGMAKLHAHIQSEKRGMKVIHAAATK